MADHRLQGGFIRNRLSGKHFRWSESIKSHARWRNGNPRGDRALRRSGRRGGGRGRACGDDLSDRDPLGHRLGKLPAGTPTCRARIRSTCAKRELQEEAGLAASDGRVLVDVASSPGFTDEATRTYLATGLSQVDRPDPEKTRRPTSACTGSHSPPRSTWRWRVRSSTRPPSPGWWPRTQPWSTASRPGRSMLPAGPTDGPRPGQANCMTPVVPALDGQLQGYDHLTIERGVAANTLSSYRRLSAALPRASDPAGHPRPG